MKLILFTLEIKVLWLGTFNQSSNSWKTQKASQASLRKKEIYYEDTAELIRSREQELLNNCGASQEPELQRSQDRRLIPLLSLPPRLLRGISAPFFSLQTGFLFVSLSLHVAHHSLVVSGFPPKANSRFSFIS